MYTYTHTYMYMYSGGQKYESSQKLLSLLLISGADPECSELYLNIKLSNEIQKLNILRNCLQ